MVFLILQLKILKVNLKPVKMKTTIKSLVMLCILAGLVSCESIKELADVEFDTTMSADLDIEVAEEAMKGAVLNYGYYVEAKINPTSDPEIEKYVDNIKEYEVTSITVVVDEVSETDVKLLQGTWFKIADATDNAVWTLPGDFDVVLGNSYTLDNKSGQWGSVQAILGRNAEFTVSSEGKANKNNITITLETSIGARVTANPL